MRGNLLVLQGKHNLHNTRDPRRSFEVPDVRLDGPNPERVHVLAGLAEHAAQGLELNRIAQRRSCTVCFNIVQVRRCQPPRPKRVAHK